MATVTVCDVCGGEIPAGFNNAGARGLTARGPLGVVRVTIRGPEGKPAPDLCADCLIDMASGAEVVPKADPVADVDDE